METAIKIVLVMMYGLAAVVGIWAASRPVAPAAPTEITRRQRVKALTISTVFTWIVAIAVLVFWDPDGPIAMVAKIYVLALLVVPWLFTVIRGGRSPRVTGSKARALGLAATSLLAVGCVLLAW